MNQDRSETVIRQFNQGTGAAYLTHEEELALVADYRETNSEKAYNKLFRSHMRLVHKMAGKFARQYNMMHEDLNQEGYIGLMKGIQGFEPEKGFRLNTYAAWWIRSTLQNHVLANSSIIRIGTTAEQKRLFFNLKRVTNDVIAKEPHIADNAFLVDMRVAQKLESTIDAVQTMRLRLQSVTSLETPIGDSDDSSLLRDMLPDDNAVTPEEALLQSNEAEHRHNLLRQAFDKAGLNDRETQIIHARRLEETPKTLEELSGIFGVSRERVRQIENKAMEKLADATRALFKKEGGATFAKAEGRVRRLRPVKVVA